MNVEAKAPRPAASQSKLIKPENIVADNEPKPKQVVN
jgi:hypothetical protein